MPNWCQGILKLRGHDEDIVKFLKEEIYRTDCDVPLSYVEFDNALLWYGNDECWEWNARIKNIHDCFIVHNILFYLKPKADINILCIDIAQAWNIDTDAFFEIAKKYHVDICISAFDGKRCFTRNIEIVNDEIIKDDEIKYKNALEYQWDVYDPRLGG